jgi:hypothetical protein
MWGNILTHIGVHHTRSPHLRQNHDHHMYQACPSMRQYDVGLAQVEMPPAYQPHLAQLEGTLDHRLCINAQHQLHDCR